MEAEARSWSLITARLVTEQAHNVMAVPGFPLDPRAAGPNSLIKDGAHPATSVQDVLDCSQGATGLKENKPIGYSHAEQGVTLTLNEINRLAALLSPFPLAWLNCRPILACHGARWQLSSLNLNSARGQSSSLAAWFQAQFDQSGARFRATRLGGCRPQASRHAFQFVILAQLFQVEDEIADEISHL